MKISEVPMLTTDEYEIELNSILYSIEWSSGYNWKGEAKWKVNAHRVIYINSASRSFRTRCANGCETEHHFSKGCDRNKLYGSFQNALKKIIEYADQDIKAAEDKMSRVDQTMKKISAEMSKIRKFRASDIKEPKAVRV
jgi:hypothetical protein